MVSLAGSTQHESPGAYDIGQRIGYLIDAARGCAEVDPPGAIERLEEAIELAGLNEAGVPAIQKQLVDALHEYGILLRGQARYETAMHSFSRALVISERLGDLRRAANQLNSIGVIYAYFGLYPDALQAFLRAQPVIAEIQDDYLEARSLNNLGFAYVRLNQPDKALPLLLQSTTLARNASEHRILANGLDSMCRAYLGLGDLERAQQLGEESLRVCHESGAVDLEAEHRISLGLVLAHRGALDDAAQCLQIALSMATANGYRREQAEAQRQIGNLSRRTGDTRMAMRHIEVARQLFLDIGAAQEAYECLFDMSQVLRDSGDFERALDYFEQFHYAKEAVFNEQANFRLKSLAITHQIDQANREREIYHLRSIALEQEVVERKNAQAAAEQRAVTDPLTGLFNRRHLLSMGERELHHASRYRRPLSVLLFDVDHFKNVNDRMGHLAGDKVLVDVADIIRDNLRLCDVAARFGGEEFVVLLPETDTSGAFLVAERIRTAIGAHVSQSEKGPISVTLSAGIVEMPAPEAETVTLDALLDRADQALYTAKAAGRDRTLVFMPALTKD